MEAGWIRIRALVCLGVATALLGSACGPLFRKKPERVRVSAEKPQRGLAASPAPTVPPPTSTAWPTPSPKPTLARPVKPGEPIGPVVTFFGITRADGTHVDPVGKDENGIPIYENYVGSGFQLVVEAKKGLSGYDVGRRVFAHDPKDPRVRPDLEIQVNRPLGDGSREICDRFRPNIGGVPAIDPPSWAETQRISDTINDLACRFEIQIESQSACTLNRNGEWEYKSKDSEIQFCMMVAKAWNFPPGDTLVSVRLRDRAGNPGPVARFWLRRPERPPTPRPVPTRPPTPKALPTR